MAKVDPRQTPEQAHFEQALSEISANMPEASDSAQGMAKMSFTDFKAAYRFSKQFGKLATPSGMTALYQHFSKIKAQENGGVVARREKYYTRAIDTFEAEADQLERGGGVGNRLDYLEAEGRFKKAKHDDVQFIVTNFGRSRVERQVTAKLIEDAEKSVKKGGMRRRNVKTATIMGSLIIALPEELSNAERKAIATDICKVFSDAAVYYLAVGHKPSNKGDKRNHHLHLIFSQRPFQKSADGQIIFSEKVDRSLQGPPFLKKLRQTVATACNKALETAGRPRRIFAGTYAENGLPFGETRLRRGVNEFQRKRSSLEAAAKLGLNTHEWAWDEAEPSVVHLMGKVIDLVEQRVAHEAQTLKTQEDIAEARKQRVAAVDQTMRQLLDAGVLFAVDKDTGALKIAKTSGDQFLGFTQYPLPASDGNRPTAQGSVGRVLAAMGDRLTDWISANGPTLMRAWAKKPEIAISAANFLKGKVAFAKSGALSVSTQDNTWVGKGLLSWLADAIRNYAAPEVTRHLSGVDVKRPDLQQLPTTLADTSSSIDRYALALSAGEPVPVVLLARARREAAAKAKIAMAVDSIPAVDAAIEQRLHCWKSAPYLVQQHRQTLTRSASQNADAMGLAAERDRFVKAEADVTSAAINPQGDLSDLTREFIHSAISLYGKSLWRDRLEMRLTKVFDQIGGPPTKRLMHYIETASIKLQGGQQVSKADLKSITTEALTATSMKAHSDAIRESRQHNLGR